MTQVCRVVCVEVRGRLVEITSLLLLHGFPEIELKTLALETSTLTCCVTSDAVTHSLGSW